MNTLLRSLIVWLLLLAVPYQGLAVAAMVACAPQHGMPARAMAPAQPVQEAQRPPCHEAAPTADAGAQEAERPHAGSAKCGSCSACGIGTAVLPVSLPQLAVHAPASASGACAAGCLPSVHLAQPERPPRPFLA